jgi:peptidyl-prolyl cis-trans isomerase SurA
MLRCRAARCLALFSLIFLWTFVSRAEEVLDGIAAVVNKDVITFSQVRELTATQERAARQRYTGNELVEKIKEIRLNALKDLIDRQLIVQDFKAKGFSVPPYIIEDRVRTLIREEFGNDRAAFVRTLQAQGYTLSRFKEIEEEKFIVSVMRAQNSKPPGVVSPQQVEAYYRENKSQYSTPEQVKLRLIVLKSEGREKMAEEIVARIKEGAEFEKMAELYSEDSTRESGGDWGWIERGTLNETLTKAAFSLKPGEVSKPIDFGGSSYLLFVEAKKNESVKPLKEVRADIEKKLQQGERQKSQERWVQGLRKKAYIKTY